MWRSILGGPNLNRADVAEEEGGKDYPSSRADDDRARFPMRHVSPPSHIIAEPSYSFAAQQQQQQQQQQQRQRQQRGVVFPSVSSVPNLPPPPPPNTTNTTTTTTTIHAPRFQIFVPKSSDHPHHVSDVSNGSLTAQIQQKQPPQQEVRHVAQHHDHHDYHDHQEHHQEQQQQQQQQQEASDDWDDDDDWEWDETDPSDEKTPEEEEDDDDDERKKTEIESRVIQFNKIEDEAKGNAVVAVQQQQAQAEPSEWTQEPMDDLLVDAGNLKESTEEGSDVLDDSDEDDDDDDGDGVRLDDDDDDDDDDAHQSQDRTYASGQPSTNTPDSEVTLKKKKERRKQKSAATAGAMTADGSRAAETSLALVTIDDEKFLSPDKVRRFRFLERGRRQLPKLEEQSVKRRHEFRTHMYELECQMAALAARLANETLDRERALRGFAMNSVAVPLESAMMRVMEKASSRTRPSGEDGKEEKQENQEEKQENQEEKQENQEEKQENQEKQEPKEREQQPQPKVPFHAERLEIRALERRAAQLETNLMKHTHVTLQHAKRRQLDVAVRDRVTRELQPAMRLEAAKASKREGTMVRRFESIAGTMARRFQEEQSSRKAGIASLQRMLETQEELDERQANEFLETLKNLRLQLKRERKERKRRDKELRQQINDTTIALKRALLEAAGDADLGTLMV